MNSRPKIALDAGHTKPYRLVSPLSSSFKTKTWNNDEIQSLLKQIKARRSIQEIAIKTNRTEFDIRSKLKSIAADMYLKNKGSYEQIQEITGVEKDRLILKSSSLRNVYVNDDETVIDMSIYNIPEDSDIEMIPIEDVITSVSDSPFSIKSFCNHISTPILSAFNSCSRYASTIT